MFKKKAPKQIALGLFLGLHYEEARQPSVVLRFTGLPHFARNDDIVNSVKDKTYL